MNMHRTGQGITTRWSEQKFVRRVAGPWTRWGEPCRGHHDGRWCWQSAVITIKWRQRGWLSGDWSIMVLDGCWRLIDKNDDWRMMDFFSPLLRMCYAGSTGTWWSKHLCGWAVGSVSSFMNISMFSLCCWLLARTLWGSIPSHLKVPPTSQGVQILRKSADNFHCGRRWLLA